jgi:hypothetical protein
MLDTVLARLDEIERAREAAQRIGPTATAVQFLQEVYRNDAIPLGVRIRAAVEAAPFESPKLSATAILPGDGDFAERLKRAIIRSRELKLIEHQPSPGAGDR